MSDALFWPLAKLSAIIGSFIGLSIAYGLSEK